MVVTGTPHIRRYLRLNDPNALRQADEAIEAVVASLAAEADRLDPILAKKESE